MGRSEASPSRRSRPKREAHVTTGRRIAEVLGPVVENLVLLQKERDRLQRMTVLPEVSRVVASLDVGNIFQRLAAVVRRVLDFDLMIVRPIGARRRARAKHTAGR